MPRIIYLALVLAVVSDLGCGPRFLRLQPELTLLESRIDRLEVLRDEMARDDLPFVNTAQWSNLVIYSGPNALPPELKWKYRALFAEAGSDLSAVIRRPESTIFVVERGLYNDGRPWVYVSYLDGNKSTRVASCENLTAAPPCGQCYLPGPGDWWISFRWAPSPTDLEKLYGSDPSDLSIEDRNAVLQELKRRCEDESDLSN